MAFLTHTGTRFPVFIFGPAQIAMRKFYSNF
jgi:hypothetical protein